jgi:hypothetical protein
MVSKSQWTTPLTHEQMAALLPEFQTLLRAVVDYVDKFSTAGRLRPTTRG